MPRKLPETEKEKKKRNDYQRELHHSKVDFITKIRDLLLPDSDVGMETRDVLREIRGIMEARRPNKVGRDPHLVFRRTIEIDGVRKSVWATSNFAKNAQLFRERANTDARRVLGVKQEENAVPECDDNDTPPPLQPMEEPKARPPITVRVLRKNHLNQRREAPPIILRARNSSNVGSTIRPQSPVAPSEPPILPRSTKVTPKVSPILEISYPELEQPWVPVLTKPLSQTERIIVENPNFFRRSREIEQAANRYTDTYAWMPRCDVTKYNKLFSH